MSEPTIIILALIGMFTVWGVVYIACRFLIDNGD